MATVRAKVFDYTVTVDRAGRLSAEDEERFVEVGEEWTPDHLLLAAVVRCSLTSLAFHARRANLDLAGSGVARGTVTKPDDEERYRFVSVEVDLDVVLDPRPDADALADLLAKAERDCFVGASLIAKPAYRWRVE